MGKRKRGGSSKSSKRSGCSTTKREECAADLQAHLQHGAESHRRREVHLWPEHYPYHLMHHSMCQDAIRETLILSLDGQQLYQINVPPDILCALVHDSIPHPPFFFRMYDSVTLAVSLEIVCLHDLYEATGPVKKDGEEQRSSVFATHVGVWEMYCRKRKGPMVTGESKDPKAETRAALDAFLTYLNAMLFQKVNSILQVDLPELWEQGLRAQARLDRFLGKEFAQRPGLWFGPAFGCVTFKYGTSEIIHLNFSDDLQYLTWCMPVGEHWEGAFFIIPQFNIKIPIRPGKMYAVLAGVVAHCSTLITVGKRLILMGFMQKDVLKQADQAVFKKGFVETDISSLYT
ncbi:hypothetical protein C8J56DRAFT_1038937 [Mycena floridula]|nr:hypothetical protein C8J56DRAFT_1038937 [Mycena floridula]